MCGRICGDGSEGEVIVVMPQVVPERGGAGTLCSQQLVKEWR